MVGRRHRLRLALRLSLRRLGLRLRYFTLCLLARRPLRYAISAEWIMVDWNERDILEVRLICSTGTREYSFMMNDQQIFAGTVGVRQIVVAVFRLASARRI